MLDAPLEGTIVKVTNPSFANQLSASKNKWEVIGVGNLSKDGKQMFICKSMTGYLHGTPCQFTKDELELF